MYIQLHRIGNNNDKGGSGGGRTSGGVRNERQAYGSEVDQSSELS